MNINQLNPKQFINVIIKDEFGWRIGVPHFHPEFNKPVRDTLIDISDAGGERLLDRVVTDGTIKQTEHVNGDDGNADCTVYWLDPNHYRDLLPDDDEVAYCKKLEQYTTEAYEHFKNSQPSRHLSGRFRHGNTRKSSRLHL